MERNKNKGEKDLFPENIKYGQEIEHDNSKTYLRVEVPVTEFKNVSTGGLFLMTYQLTELGQRLGCSWAYLNDATMFKKISKNRAEKIVSRKAESIGKVVAMKPDEKVFIVPSLQIFHA
ncbi:MAG: hypothetical protein M1334_03570 [Patescibacteria group bacterium]|nr:hypothetical protein [Patescibacteria group bacterium]